MYEKKKKIQAWKQGHTHSSWKSACLGTDEYMLFKRPFDVPGIGTNADAPATVARKIVLRIVETRKCGDTGICMSTKFSHSVSVSAAATNMLHRC